MFSKVAFATCMHVLQILVFRGLLLSEPHLLKEFHTHEKRVTAWRSVAVDHSTEIFFL